MTVDPILPCSATVIKRYDAAYPEPFFASKDEQVKILPPPEDWPEFHWCEAANGEKRWIPLQFLIVRGAVGFLNQDYESTEISVEPSEELTLLKITAGWAWCQKSDGKQGWLPVENLKLD